MHTAFAPIRGLMSGVMRFSGVGALIGAAGGAVGGFEFLKDASHVSAERETLRTQLHTLLENQGKGGYTQELINQIRTYSDLESTFSYSTVANTAATMLASRYKPEQIKPEMQKLGDLAATNDQFKLIGEIFSGAHNMGYITKSMLNRLVSDAHVPIMAAVLQAMGQADTRQNQIALFKRLRTPSKDPVDVSILEKAASILTGPGGAMHGHQMAQLMTWEGQAQSVRDRVKDVQQGFGDMEHKVLFPWMREINKISPLTIQGWFDKAIPTVQKFSDDIIAAKNNLEETGEIRRAWEDVKDIFSKARAELYRMLGIKPGETVHIAEVLEHAFKRVREALDWIDGHMAGLISAAKAYVAVWAAFKLGGLALNIASFAGSLLMVRNALVGVGAVEGAEGAIGMALFGAGGSVGLIAAISAVGAAIVGIGIWKASQLDNDKTMNADALAARNSARATQGLPAQSAADAMNDPVMKAHWDRSAKVSQGAQEWWNSDVAGEWKAMWQGLGDGFNNIKKALPSDESWNALKSGTIDSAAGLNKIVSSSSSAAAGLDALRDKLYSISIPSISGPRPQGQGDRPHALGGIFTRRHYGTIAESGAEAVIPLTNRVRASGLMAKAGLAGGSGHVINFAPVLHISGGQDPNAAGREIVRIVRDALPGLLKEADERMSWESFA